MDKPFAVFTVTFIQLMAPDQLTSGRTKRNFDWIRKQFKDTQAFRGDRLSDYLKVDDGI